MDGWIKIHRQSQENDLYFLEPFTKRQAWGDLLLTTSFKKSNILVRGCIIEIEKGQNAYSEDTLANRWKRSRNKVRNFLNYLETIQQIEQHKSKVKSIITIINREKYQGNDTTEGTTKGQQKVQQKDTIKKDKEVIRNKEDIIEILSSDEITENRNPLNILLKIIDMGYRPIKDKKELLLDCDWIRNLSKQYIPLKENGSPNWEEAKIATDGRVDYWKNPKPKSKYPTNFKSSLRTSFSNYQKWKGQTT